MDKPSRSLVTSTPNQTNTSGITNELIKELPQPYSANEKSKDLAKRIVKNLKPVGVTNVYDSLKIAFHLAQLSEGLTDEPEPIVFFVANGWATIGEKRLDEMLSMTEDLNNGVKRIKLHTLALGRNVRKEKLKQLSLANFGSMKIIYEAPDVASQMEEMYYEVACPVLSNVRFQYGHEDVATTKGQFETVNEGQVVFVSGKFSKPKRSYEISNFIVQAQTHERVGRYFPEEIIVISNNDVVERTRVNLEQIWAYMRMKEYLHSMPRSDNKNVLNNLVNRAQMVRKPNFRS